MKRPGPPLGKNCPNLLHQSEKGGGFNSATSRSGRSPDKHQQDQYKQSRIGQLSYRIGGKAGRTGRHTVEKSPQPGHLLGGLQQQGAHQQKGPCGRQYYLGVERQTMKASGLIQVDHHQEPHSPTDDQSTGSQIEQYIIPIRDQIPQSTQNIKPRIVKGRNRVKHADPKGPQGRVVLNKDQKTQHHAGQLKTQGHPEHRADQPHHPLNGVDVQGLFHQKAAPDAHPLPGGQDQTDAHRGNAQSPYLDQSGHHRLAEKGKMIGGVNGDQTCHTHGAGRGEQRVDPSHLGVWTDRNRQQEKQGPQQNRTSKPQHDQSPRMLPPEKCKN